MTGLPVAASQTRAVPSTLAVTRSWPSGLNLTVRTEFECTFSAAAHVGEGEPLRALNLPCLVNEGRRALGENIGVPDALVEVAREHILFQLSRLFAALLRMASAANRLEALLPKARGERHDVVPFEVRSLAAERALVFRSL